MTKVKTSYKVQKCNFCMWGNTFGFCCSLASRGQCDNEGTDDPCFDKHFGFFFFSLRLFSDLCSSWESHMSLWSQLSWAVHLPKSVPPRFHTAASLGQDFSPNRILGEPNLFIPLMSSFTCWRSSYVVLCKTVVFCVLCRSNLIKMTHLKCCIGPLNEKFE